MALSYNNAHSHAKRSLLCTLITISAALFMTACSTTKPPVTDMGLSLNLKADAELSTEKKEYTVGAGDELEIKFFYNPELNETIVVRPDGKISLQLIDEVTAAGLTPAELDDVLTSRYSSELKMPSISVIVRSFSNQKIFVGGEVNNPSSLALGGRMTALQAVLAAGGLKDTANPKQVMVVTRNTDEDHQAYAVDLQSSMFGGDSLALLKPGDIVFVPKSGIAKANLFTDQYIRKLLLFNGFRVGYDLND